MDKELLIGWAQTNVTPDRPVELQGQMYKRISEYVRDPLTATCLVIDNGDEQVTFISVDIIDCPYSLMPQLRAALADMPGFDPSKITMNGIHTHNSFTFGIEEEFLPQELIVPEELKPEKVEDESVMSQKEGGRFLLNKLINLVRDAWKSRAQGGVASAQDYAVVAFNRRPMFDMGNGKIESKMYGVCSQPNFLRLEGTSDHSADMLYTWDSCGNLTGVAVSIPCPAQVHELHRYITADFWADARACIREELGQIHVLPLCGASGDQNPLDLIRLSKTNEKALNIWNSQAGEVMRNIDLTQECRDIGERIADAVKRGYRKARNRVETRPVLRHAVMDLEFPIRTVSDEEYLAAKTEVEEVLKKFSPENKLTDKDMVGLFGPCGDMIRYRDQQICSTTKQEFHMLRIGTMGIVSQPFEMFVEFALRIKARAKAPQTVVLQKANGMVAYLPTQAAIDGGSYSSKPSSTLCGPDAGDLLVERAIEELDKLFTDDN